MTVRKKAEKESTKPATKATASVKGASKPKTTKVSAVKASPKKTPPKIESKPPVSTAKTETPVKPAAAPVAPPSAPSIKSVKEQFLIQRAVAAKKPATPPSNESAPKRTPQAPSTSSYSAPSSAHSSSAHQAAPKIKTPVQEIKKTAPKPIVNETPQTVSAPVVSGTPAAPAATPAYVAPARVPTPEIKKVKKIEIPTTIVVKELAAKLSINPSELIQRLIKQGIFANINQAINFEMAAKISAELGFEAEQQKATSENLEDSAKEISKENKALLVARAPIVTFMGHVDHGKTSLLDAIRKTKVAAGEAGGITQHIGAYEVFLEGKGAVTFLDTPGHEAFTQMRARGAKATDVVVLVVAADDGVMPQTIEAIDHAKAANVPIIVAINKIDLPSANPDRVKKSLMEHGLMAEEWGGKTIMAGVSAKTGQGIDELLEMLALESELLELKANPSAMASGVVVEAELSKDSGVLATMLVQDGTLRVGDVLVVGPFHCKVRAMINDRGHRVKEALPSMPVAILGLSGVPKAGDRFYVVKDEKTAKEILEKKNADFLEQGGDAMAHVTLEHLFEDVKAGKVEELKLIIKSDVQGSVEALRATLGKIQSKNVRLNIIHTGSGDITESDVMLAVASNAVVIGFHVGIVGTAKEAANREMVDVRFYEIIYEVKTAIEKAMEGLLEPELRESFVGMAEVRQVFKVSKAGTIAGCSVQKGKIIRNHQCRVIRNGVKVHEGKVESLKRFKDDAREVLEGFECGIGVSKFDEILPGDRIEVYEIQKKARKLE